MRSLPRTIIAAVAVIGAAAAVMAPSANAIVLNPTPAAICASIGLNPSHDFDYNLAANPAGRFAGSQYYGGPDEMVWGANTPNSGMTCLQAAQVGLKLAGLGFQELALDYNGQSTSGVPYIVIENEDGGELSAAGVQAMASQARIWGIIYGTTKASLHMFECYCY